MAHLRQNLDKVPGSVCLQGVPNFGVLLTVHLDIFISVFTQLYAQNLFHNTFISCLYIFGAHGLIIRRSKLHYTASGIIKPIGGLCTRRSPIGVMIPEAV